MKRRQITLLKRNRSDATQTVSRKRAQQDPVAVARWMEQGNTRTEMSLRRVGAQCALPAARLDGPVVALLIALGTRPAVRQRHSRDRDDPLDDISDIVEVA
jgi:hypothetical protein